MNSDWDVRVSRSEDSGVGVLRTGEHFHEFQGFSSWHLLLWVHSLDLDASEDFSWELTKLNAEAAIRELKSLYHNMGTR